MNIRLLAGGVLAENPPSPHTHNSPFFPLSLHEKDRRRATQIRNMLGAEQDLPEIAIRFALAHPYVTSALVGFANPSQIDDALRVFDETPSLLNWDD